MHREIFIVGTILTIVGFLIIFKNFFVNVPDPVGDSFMDHDFGNVENTFSNHLLGMGIAAFGGILVTLSRAMRHAAQRGIPLIDQMIDMSAKETPVSSTETTVIVGNNNTVDSNKNNTSINQPVSSTVPLTSGGQEAGLLDFQIAMKDLVAKNKIRECLEQMKIYFYSNGNKSALNDVILLNSRFRENEDLFDGGLISDETRAVQAARLAEALVKLIDNEINW